MKPLTARQREVFDVIAKFIREHGLPPSQRDIAAAIGVSSTNGVNDFLTALERKGWIERVPKISRGIRITERTAS